jgi:squalene-hopene/tetraprenyl-beta-curcumene cyclase
MKRIRFPARCSSPPGTLWVVAVALPLIAAADPPEFQYRHQDLAIPAFRADEPRRATVSIALAEEYLRNGALAWARSQGCVSCHTTGLYLVTRPSLTPHLGPPLAEVREFFVRELQENLAAPREELLKSTRPAQVIFTAAGLADWDRHVTRALSTETRQALAQMFDLQLDTGTWGTLDCWPPYESDAFHLATQAAMAIAAAPGWLAELKDPKQLAGVEKLRKYLGDTPPPHDYARLLLLWASARLPDLLPAAKRREGLELLTKHQRPDGGWSIRTFAAPEAWGRGNRAAKLREEPEFEDPPSDGHQTGLALIVMREHGIPGTDPRLRRGLRWLKENQRVSGRWWTRSLNTDSYHFISYSGTAYPLLALALCGELDSNALKVGTDQAR